MTIRRCSYLRRENQSFKYKIASYCFISVLFISKASAQHHEQSFVFDQSMLLGGGKNIDINKFSENNYVPTGQYLVNLFVNSNFYEKKEVEFKLDKTETTSPCFSPEELESMGILLKKANASIETKSAQCLFIQDVIPDAKVSFDSANLRLNLLIPQIYIKQDAKGFVPESSLNAGTAMLFANYDTNYYKNKSKGYNSDYAFASFNGGINLGLWQFRQQASMNYTSTENNSGKKTKFNWIRTYLQRPIVSLKSQLLVGEISTAGSIFGSLSFRGVQLISDDRMLPDSQKGYAPVIRGVATTTARVSVKQNGVEIYQTTVSPGQFEITDLYPTSYEGDLLVEVQEANDKVTSFVVPFSAVPESVRPGYTRYAIAMGELKNFNRINNRFVDASFQHGLTNMLTLSSGVRAADKYYAASVGTVLATQFGAFGLQSAFSNADINGETHQGARVGINYSRTLSTTNTIITLAGYKYSTEGFRELADVLGVRGMKSENEVWNSNTYKQESQMVLHINQSLGEWGQVFTSGSINNYYGNRERDTQFQLGYSNTYKNIGYSIVYSQQKVGHVNDNYTYSDQRDNSKTDKIVMFTVSVPLGGSYDSPMLMLGGTNSDSNSSYQANLSGIMGEDQTLSYSVNADYDANNRNVSSGIHLTKQFPEATISGSVSKGENYTQGSLSARGAIVAHSGGVTMGPYVSDTFALVEAQGAKGARVINGSGASIDRFGYAIIPSLIPYQYNNVGLDSKEIEDNHVALTENSQKIAPYAGANVKLKFNTSVGYPILISIPQSVSLPLGADVYDVNKQVVGLVGQGNQIYARVEQLNGTLSVAQQLGDCHVTYNIPDDKKALSLILLNETCE
ncbi:fimbria/pilus outer membrane usher protein [Providencia alcalifaciens]|uniref:fimbria/pilus outer membrane usher protein n=1 Tax=Providencia alcalifaciens TaxID=126385 RepID=UPI001CC6CBFA|nr:fimbria/pilus outer membrane usher protein [Providencia alcalifaciens]CAG9406612.1 Outer membrane usher protein FimD [Providencia alcalifaciens]